MKRFLLFTLVLVVTLFFSIPVFAESLAVESTSGERLADMFLRSILPLLGALVAALISIVLFKLKQRLNIQISADTEAWITKQAEAAVQYVGEIAAKKFKQHDIKLTSHEKLDSAIGFLVSKVPAISNAQAVQYVESALGRVRGEGATGNRTLSV